MAIEEQMQRLTRIAESLAGSVVAHDNQIESLIKMAERHEKVWQDLQRQWQAYINTLPRS